MARPRSSPFWPDRRKKPDPAVVRINWNHPMARGLVGCFIPTNGGPLIDLVSGAVIQRTGAVKQEGDRAATVGASGVENGFKAGVNDATLTPGLLMDRLAPANVSLFWRGHVVGSGEQNAGVMVVCFNTPETAPYVSYGIFRNGVAWDAAFFYASDQGLNNVAVPVGVFDPYGVSSVGLVAGGPTPGSVNEWLIGYAKGKRVGSIGAGTDNTKPVFYGTTSMFGMGIYTSTNRNSDAEHECGFIWNRRLTDDEMARMDADPYAFLEPITRRSRVYQAIVSSGPYALAAAGGTFAWTGATATIQAARKLAASAGTYAVTGATATPAAARKLTAAGGSFSWAGAAATFAKGRVLAAAAGSFVMTGATAVATATRKLTASGGTFSLTGASATLGRGRLMTAAAGVFSMTGATATFKAARKLAAAVGSYLVTDRAVTFDYAQVFIPTVIVTGTVSHSTTCSGTVTADATLTASVEIE